MHRSTRIASIFVAPAVFVLTACGDQRTPTEATHTAARAVAINADALGPGHSGGIVAHDACDPATFNQTEFGPRTCLKEGRTTFPQFIAELTATQAAKGWELTPGNLTARFGVDIQGNNIGGEVHTFTPVRQFGGGFIQVLNDLTGNPVPAPECLQLDDDDKVPAGGKYAIEAEKLASVVDASGIARVQCCVHPWMRTEVRMQHAAL